MKKVEFVGLAILVCALCLFLFCGGCNGEWKKKAELPTEKLTAGNVVEVIKWRDKIEKIYETNWLSTMCIIGMIGGLAVCWTLPKIGATIFMTAAAGLGIVRSDQALASNLWIYLIVGIVMLAAIGAYIYTHIFRDKIIFYAVNQTPAPLKVQAAIDKIKNGNGIAKEKP